jgi:hypothetical protein
MNTPYRIPYSTPQTSFVILVNRHLTNQWLICLTSKLTSKSANYSGTERDTMDIQQVKQAYRTLKMNTVNRLGLIRPLTCIVRRLQSDTRLFILASNVDSNAHEKRLSMTIHSEQIAHLLSTPLTIKHTDGQATWNGSF